METDIYKTITGPSPEALFKDRSSKFLGYAFPVTNEEQVKEHIESLKKQHRSARHWCYAYQLGTGNKTHRANDDGEPNNSAGMPIFGQIQSFEVTNVLVVVVRYFGGTKLGVGGLINAYRTAAHMALEASRVVERTINKRILVTCTYDHLNKVMRVIKDNGIRVIEQDMQLHCRLTIEVRIKDADGLWNQFRNLHNVTAEYLDQL